MRRTFVALVLAVVAIGSATGQIYKNNQLNVVVLGDSNTWIGGDDCDNAKGWNKWFKDLFRPASCKSYARSGATWTNTSGTVTDTEEDIAVLGDNNVVYNQIMRLRQSVENGSQVVPDLVIIAAGTNDAWFQDKRPGIFTAGTEMAIATIKEPLSEVKVGEMTSLAQSVLYGIALLRESLPQVQIILFTPLQCTATSIENIQRVGDVIEECANVSGVGCIRQDGSEFIDREKELRHRHFTSDGTHTNALGARHNAELIAKMVAVMTRKN